MLTCSSLLPGSTKQRHQNRRAERSALSERLEGRQGLGHARHGCHLIAYIAGALGGGGVPRRREGVTGGEEGARHGHDETAVAQYLCRTIAPPLPATPRPAPGCVHCVGPCVDLEGEWCWHSAQSRRCHNYTEARGAAPAGHEAPPPSHLAAGIPIRITGGYPARPPSTVGQAPALLSRDCPRPRPAFDQPESPYSRGPHGVGAKVRITPEPAL